MAIYFLSTTATACYLCSDIDVDSFPLVDFDKKYFWNWSDFQSYVDCMLVFTIVSSVITYLMLEQMFFVELVGFFAVFTEAMLGTPQLIKNYQNKSTEGMRYVNSYFACSSDS